MPTTHWKPSVQSWGDLAYGEVMDAFFGQVKTRAVAICIWFLAFNSGVSIEDIESLAQQDPEIQSKKGQVKKISPRTRTCG